MDELIIGRTVTSVENNGSDLTLHFNDGTALEFHAKEDSYWYYNGGVWSMVTFD